MLADDVAAQLGARVLTTAGTAEKRDFCRSLGAEVAIDYHDEDFVEAVLGPIAVDPSPGRADDCDGALGGAAFSSSKTGLGASAGTRAAISRAITISAKTLELKSTGAAKVKSDDTLDLGGKTINVKGDPNVNLN